MPGDFLDLQHLFLHHADHNVQAMTRLATVEINREALQDLALSNPPIGRALCRCAGRGVDLSRMGGRQYRAQSGLIRAVRASRAPALSSPRDYGWSGPAASVRQGGKRVLQ